jgi:RNA polymerase sigma-70 factor (ECF subfamily)
VLILREVLGFSAQETAELLETTVASVNSAMQRARKTIEEKLPSQSQQETLRAIGDERLREVVEGYMDAMGRGDVEAVVAMLAEDAAWSMPPMATWYLGHESLRRFLIMGPLSGAWRWAYRPAMANGQPAIGAYTWREDEGCYRPFALDVLTLSPDGAKIDQVTSFIARSGDELTPEELANFPDEAVEERMVASIFTRVGLPDRLD